MLTASGQDEDRVLAEEAGANGFLTKPASSAELLDAVGNFLG
jgi:DNA-binding response OmpR family regulator